MTAKVTKETTTMNIEQAKQAIELVRQQKTEIDGLLASICGGAAPIQTADWAVGTIGPIDSIAAYSHAMGKRVLVRTATYFLDGVLIEVYPQELVLQDASTVFSVGTQSNLATGKWAEAEAHPKGRLVVSRGAIIDVALVG